MFNFRLWQDKTMYCSSAMFFRTLFSKYKLRRVLPFLFERFTGVLYLNKYCGFWGEARCIGHPRIFNYGDIRIGRDFRLKNSYLPVEITCFKGATITMGEHVNINYGTLISAQRSIKIGNRVMIGNLSIISDTLFPLRVDQFSPSDDRPRPIEICDDVWLAVRVTVLPGSKIGRGSVIGAGSIVSGEIPAGVVAIGNPARPVSYIKKVRADTTEVYTCSASVAQQE